MQTLTYADLKQAVAGQTSAIRRITRLLPAGGDGDKVFPPTYEGGQYATEERKMRASDGSVRSVSTVLLDSVQSQANRMELALLRGYEARTLRFPLVLVDFAKNEERALLRDIGRITALEAPHRLADAIFRDSLRGSTPFRESELGGSLDQARPANATPLFGVCPTALVFGIWDSTGPKGGLGAKFQRALVSEIVAYDVQAGVRPSSRIDPLGIEIVPIYLKRGGGWTTEAAEAEARDGKPLKFGKEGKPSELNHGNVTPSLAAGGFTIAYAVQTTVLSLAALRRLRFPVNGQVVPNQHEIDRAARTTLAALGLAAITFLDQDGCDLRSRCLLDGKSGAFELVERGDSRTFDLTPNGAAALLNEAAAEAVRLGLPWPLEPEVLLPSEELKQLILKSRAKTMTAAAG